MKKKQTRVYEKVLVSSVPETNPPITKLSSHEQNYIQDGLQHTSSGWWLASLIFLLLAAPHLWDMLTGWGDGLLLLHTAINTWNSLGKTFTYPVDNTLLPQTLPNLLCQAPSNWHFSSHLHGRLCRGGFWTSQDVSVLSLPLLREGVRWESLPCVYDLESFFSQSIP